MAQLLDPLPNNQASRLLCCYVNATNQIQIARITNIDNWYFERVVFPGQRLVFEALQEALLEIHSGTMASAILSDTIPCERLSVNESVSSQSSSHSTIAQIPASSAHKTAAKIVEHKQKTISQPLGVTASFG